MPFTLQQYVIKLSVMGFTIGIGLWCGWNDRLVHFILLISSGNK